MQVPTLDLKAQYRTIREDVEAAVLNVLNQQAFILGATVKDFEAAVADYCGSRHACGVSSGTDALLLAMMAEGLKVGDEVITTAYSFFATAGSIARTGATPVFVDIDPLTFNIDPAKIEEKITPRTRAIVPVHLYGQAADMDPILEIAKKHGLVVIEDVAQAIGAEDKGRRTGTLGDYGCFSFFPSKNLGGAGDGGMVTTQDDDRAERLMKMRVHGEVGNYKHKYIGGNFRLDALQAAVLQVKLPHLDTWTEMRRKNARIYRELFAEAGLTIDPADVDGFGVDAGSLAGRKGVVLPMEREDGRHIYNQFIIRSDRRDDLLAHLHEREVGARLYYPIPLHLQECFAYVGDSEGDMPAAECAANQSMALPIYPEMTREMQEFVVASIAEFQK